MTAVLSRQKKFNGDGSHFLPSKSICRLITVMGGPLCVCKIAIFLITRSVAPVLMIFRGKVAIHLNSRVNIHKSCLEVLHVASTSVQVHQDKTLKKQTKMFNKSKISMHVSATGEIICIQRSTKLLHTVYTYLYVCAHAHKRNMKADFKRRRRQNTTAWLDSPVPLCTCCSVSPGGRRRLGGLAAQRRSST